ncbi:MAG: hypothetical protein K2X98_03570 [Alphaproteobacteria bacterium]|nr:hypothetical protein [Alphaproteobacteria bacterium]
MRVRKKCLILFLLYFLMQGISMAMDKTPFDACLDRVRSDCKRIQNSKFPEGLPEVVASDYDFIQEKCGFSCPDQARKMLMVLYKYRLPSEKSTYAGFDVPSPNLNSNNYLLELMNEAFERGVPYHVITFSDMNGSYWCITKDEEVVLYEPEFNGTNVAKKVDQEKGGGPYSLVTWLNQWVLGRD